MAEAAEDRIFGRVPDLAFRLFSGRARRYYAGLLGALSADLFASGAAVGHAQFQDAVADYTASWDWAHRAMDGEGDEDLVEAGVQGRAGVACRRLVETGWICMRRDRYRRSVDMDPGARMLLDSLLEIRDSNTRSYGGEVLGVLSQVEAARLDPENRSEAVSNAAKLSKAFVNHLRLVGATVRAAEEEVVRKRDFGSMFAAFFDDFVAQHLIEDYKRLRTRSNPYRFRGRILDITDELSNDDIMLDVLASAYVREGRAADVEGACVAILAELAVVGSTFRNIDAYLHTIEETAARLETRIANAVRHMDRVGQSESSPVAAAFSLLVASGLDDACTIDVLPPRMPPGLPNVGSHLYQVATRAVRTEARAILRPVRDPADIAHQQALSEYAARARVGSERIEQFLERIMAGRDSINAGSIKVDNLDDFYVLERLRSMGHMHVGLTGRWRILPSPDGAYADGEWLSFRDYIIQGVPAHV